MTGVPAKAEAPAAVPSNRAALTAVATRVRERSPHVTAPSPSPARPGGNGPHRPAGVPPRPSLSEAAGRVRWLLCGYRVCRPLRALWSSGGGPLALGAGDRAAVRRRAL